MGDCARYGSFILNCGTSRRGVAARFRALALLGRLPSAHVDGHVMQASEKPAQEAKIDGAPTAADWLLFGVPGDPDALARHYTFTRSDQDLVAGRRGDTNRLGFAVQLALL